jgi:hypothetical protein
MLTFDELMLPEGADDIEISSGDEVRHDDDVQIESIEKPQLQT